MKAIIKNLRRGERERVICCPKCGTTASADRNDYFMLVEKDTLKCCNRIMDVLPINKGGLNR
jgi:uncharacterized C2H2 Zn-finger protein